MTMRLKSWLYDTISVLILVEIMQKRDKRAGLRVILKLLGILFFFFQNGTCLKKHASYIGQFPSFYSNIFLCFAFIQNTS